MGLRRERARMDEPNGRKGREGRRGKRSSASVWCVVCQEWDVTFSFKGWTALYGDVTVP